MKQTLTKNEVQYQNLFDGLTFPEGKPCIEAVGEIETTQFKRVCLKAGTELKCHKTEQHVAVVWLRGKAEFQANEDGYTMHPGSMLHMPAGTPHGAKAETDCVFLVIKIA